MIISEDKDDGDFVIDPEAIAEAGSGQITVSATVAGLDGDLIVDFSQGDTVDLSALLDSAYGEVIDAAPLAADLVTADVAEVVAGIGMLDTLQATSFTVILSEDDVSSPVLTNIII